MPIRTASELVKQPKISFKDSMVLEELEDMLISVNNDRESYLREELKPLKDAIFAVRKQSGTYVELDGHLEKLNKLEEFLVGGEGMANYTRILSDLSRKHPDQSREYEDTLDKGIMILSNYLGLGIKQEELTKKINAKGVDPSRLTIRINTKQVDKKDMLMAERAKGKTFMEPGSYGYNHVSRMKEDITKVIDDLRKPDVKSLEGGKNSALSELQAKIPENERKELADNLEKFKNAVEVLQSKDPSEPEVSNALKTVRDFNEYLTKGINGSNYQRYLTAGMKEGRFVNGLQSLESVLVNGLDIEKVKKAKGYTVVEAKADEWIKNWQRQMKKRPDAFTVGSKETKMFLAKIMATRMLVNSVRGQGDAFEKKVTNLDIERKAEELMQNKTFADFINKIGDNKKGLEQAGKAIAKGHCGGLDDALKNYMLRLPAGQLSNDKALIRYMPKVIDRIEVLQERAKARVNSPVGRGEIPKTEIAEIYALRSMIRTQGGKKELLNVSIPTDRSLTELTARNRNDEYFNGAFKPADMDLLFKGHGGEFAQRELKSEKIKPGSPLWVSMNTGREEMIGDLYNLDLGTRTGRSRYLQLKALMIQQKLEDAIAKNPNSKETQELCGQVADILLEGCALEQNYIENKENFPGAADEKLDKMDLVRVGLLKERLNTPEVKEEMFENKPEQYLFELKNFTSFKIKPTRSIQILMKAHNGEISWSAEEGMNRKLSPKQIAKIQQEVMNETGAKPEDLADLPKMDGKGGPKVVHGGPVK